MSKTRNFNNAKRLNKHKCFKTMLFTKRKIKTKNLKSKNCKIVSAFSHSLESERSIEREALHNNVYAKNIQRM